MKDSMREQRRRAGVARIAAFSALALLALCLPGAASAQWTAPDAQGNTSTTSTGNVGVGTAAPASKLDVSGTSGVTVRTGGASAGLSIFDRPSVPGDQVVFQGNAGNYTMLNTATRNANFGSEKVSGIAMWTVDNAYTPNATQFQIQNSPSFGGVLFTQKFGTGAQGDKKVSFQTAWNQVSEPKQFVLDTNGNVGVGTASPLQPLHVIGKGLVQNTGAASSFIMDRTDGKIAAFGAGGGSTSVAYDDTGIFKIESNSRANIAGGNFSSGAVTRLAIDGAGNVGVGTAAPASKLHVAGNITVDGNINAKYQDVAEWVPTTQKLQAGTVVVLDSVELNHVLASSKSYDTGVAGVVSAQPGIALGEAGEGKVLVATTGRVRVRVDATRAPIKVGDLLVTSDVQGVAMKSQPLDLSGVAIHRPGTLIGKALEPLAGGTGEILVLLSLQ